MATVHRGVLCSPAVQAVTVAVTVVVAVIIVVAVAVTQELVPLFNQK